MKIIYLLLLMRIHFVFSHYCEFAWCNDETQDCCGDNKCCDKSLDLTFVWVGFLIAFLIITIIFIWHKWKTNQSKTDYKYHTLQTEPPQTI